MTAKTILLDGNSLTREQLVAVARQGLRVELDEAQLQRVQRAAKSRERLVGVHRRVGQSPFQLGVLGEQRLGSLEHGPSFGRSCQHDPGRPGRAPVRGP